MHRPTDSQLTRLICSVHLVPCTIGQNEAATSLTPHTYAVCHEGVLNVLSVGAGPVVNLCLGGFVAAIRITSLLSMGMLRNTFVTSVCRFTMLHAPQSMQIKNAHAFRALLIVADENGNHMHVSFAANLQYCMVGQLHMLLSPDWICTLD